MSQDNPKAYLVDEKACLVDEKVYLVSELINNKINNLFVTESLEIAKNYVNKHKNLIVYYEQLAKV